MPRFDVHHFKSANVSFVVNIQADILSDFQTRVVVPLVPLSLAKNESLPILKPIIMVNGKEYIFMATDIGTIRTKELGKVVANLDNERLVITAALDFLFQGF